MRKLGFYPKLAAGNLWRNRSTYAPFLLACVTCIFTLYSLLAISNSGSLASMRGAEYVQIFIYIGIFLLGIFCIALLFWTNGFLIRRRKKELALYSVLGMEKTNIAIVMLFETLFIAALALALGIVAGVLLSRLLFWGLLQLIRYEVMLTLSVDFAAIGATCVFFALVFGLTFLSNLRQVRLANPVELMAGARQGEKEPKSSVLLTLLGFACLGGGYFIAVYFASPLEAIMYFLVAALLVIIGTFCLFTSGSVAVLKMLRRNKSYYYKPNHFISVSGLIYRMKQNAAGLSAICVLSCMVLVTLGTTVGLYTGMDSTLETMYPTDHQINTNNDALVPLARQAVADNAAQTGILVQDEKLYHYYEGVLEQNEDGSYRAVRYYNGDNTTQLFLVTQADLRANDGISVEVPAGGALLYAKDGYRESSLTVQGQEIPVVVTEEKLDVIISNILAAHYMIMVVEDEAALQGIVDTFVAAADEETAERIRALSWQYVFNVEGDTEQEEAFRLAMTEFYEQYRAEGLSYGSQVDAREELYYMNGGFLFLGIFFGALFLMAATLIMYYKQLSEGYDDATRFDILQKVGMSTGEVRKTILSQVRSVFFLPLLVAVVHIAVAFIPVRRGLMLMGVMNPLPVVLSFVVIILAYTLVYLFVYRRTASAYFHIVRKAQ